MPVLVACTSAGPVRDELAGQRLDEPPVRGTLRCSTFADSPTGREPGLHTSVFVPGPDYRGMEDNDMRGFLDGCFKCGWNQPGQIHVRIGRRDRNPRYGEHELFRALYRWGGIELPPQSTVSAATLTLQVESGPAFPVRVMLYEIKQDWDPGQGGTAGDNVSPPRRGEVWWNARAHEVAPWGLPGAGYASDRDPRADTAAMPLAEADYRPGDATLVFDGAELAAYATRRLATGAPLLLLIKLADFQEDILGSELDVYSASQGDSMNLVRRPALTLAWRGAAELDAVETRVLVEYGRTIELPRVEARGARWIAWTFHAEQDSLRPTVEARMNGAAEEWSHLGAVERLAADGIELRLQAARNRVVLGQLFVSEFKDAWVRSAPPEQQEVLWRFISPTGVAHDVRGAYQGGHLWKVSFEPDELGPWRYDWTQNFTEVLYRSAEGTFDTVIGDRANASRQLERFLHTVENGGGGAKAAPSRRTMVVFQRLERAALQLETPESHASPAGAELWNLLRKIRGQLGEPVPDAIPLEPIEPPEWATVHR